MLKGLGGLGDMAKMMKTATELQAKMAELQAALARTVVIGEAADGLVRARATAKGNLTGLEIDPVLLEPAKKEFLEDMIIAAIQDAQARGAAHSQQEMTRLTESLGLPADMKLPI